jgi:hypothetical protein
VLVVLGDDLDDDVLSGLLAGLSGRAVGVVAVGDTVTADSGDLKALRGEDLADEVATVDGVDTGIGRVTAALALARSVRVQGGSFGASGSDGAVPLG